MGRVQSTLLSRVPEREGSSEFALFYAGQTVRSGANRVEEDLGSDEYRRFLRWSREYWHYTRLDFVLTRTEPTAKMMATLRDMGYTDSDLPSEVRVYTFEHSAACDSKAFRSDLTFGDIERAFIASGIGCLNSARGGFHHVSRRHPLAPTSPINGLRGRDLDTRSNRQQMSKVFADTRRIIGTAPGELRGPPITDVAFDAVVSYAQRVSQLGRAIHDDHERYHQGGLARYRGRVWLLRPIHGSWTRRDHIKSASSSWLHRGCAGLLHHLWQQHRLLVDMPRPPLDLVGHHSPHPLRPARTSHHH